MGCWPEQCREGNAGAVASRFLHCIIWARPILGGYLGALAYIWSSSPETLNRFGVAPRSCHREDMCALAAANALVYTAKQRQQH
jgi:hypothetical protein